MNKPRGEKKKNSKFTEKLLLNLNSPFFSHDVYINIKTESRLNNCKQDDMVQIKNISYEMGFFFHHMLCMSFYSWFFC